MTLTIHEKQRQPIDRRRKTRMTIGEIFILTLGRVHDDMATYGTVVGGTRSALEHVLTIERMRAGMEKLRKLLKEFEPAVLSGRSLEDFLKAHPDVHRRMKQIRSAKGLAKRRPRIRGGASLVAMDEFDPPGADGNTSSQSHEGHEVAEAERASDGA